MSQLVLLSELIFFNELISRGHTITVWYYKIFRLLPRGFYDPVKNTVFINQDAWFLDGRDYELLKKHEFGHSIGLNHAFFGYMADNALIRYLTS